VVFLRFFADESLDGIALALNCSVGTVKSRLFNGLERLRKMAEKEFEK
jgi:RNA polymerase sigma-70 factor (ECF subfamily)